MSKDSNPELFRQWIGIWNSFVFSSDEKKFKRDLVFILTDNGLITDTKGKRICNFNSEPFSSAVAKFNLEMWCNTHWSYDSEYLYFYHIGRFFSPTHISELKIQKSDEIKKIGLANSKISENSKSSYLMTANICVFVGFMGKIVGPDGSDKVCSNPKHEKDSEAFGFRENKFRNLIVFVKQN